MKKIGTYLFFFTSFLCIALFVLVHMQPEFINKCLRAPEKAGYDDFRPKGDLYYMCQVDNFNDYVPPAKYKFRESFKQSPPDSADVIIFGDSFFDHSRFPSIADRLHDSLGLKVCMIRNYYLPDSILAKAKKGALIIAGIVERNIIETYREDGNNAPSNSYKTKLLNYIFPWDLERRYLLLSRRSCLTEGACDGIATFSFNFFHLYNRGIQLDSASDKIFLGDVFRQPSKNPFKKITDLQIDSVVTQIQLTANKITRSGHAFIFFPLPNKETIYYHSNTPYNNFLPALYAKLKQRNIQVVDVYSLFKENAAGELYFRTDTHWNGNGISLGFNELRKILPLAR